MYMSNIRFSIKSSLQISNITNIMYRMQFGSQLALRVILTPAAGVTIDTVTVDDSDVAPVRSGDSYYVTIGNILASNLLSEHEVSCMGASATLSPMSYVYSMLTSDSEYATNEGKNLVCALYYFAGACNADQGESTNG